jgi:hypothetical protein
MARRVGGVVALGEVWVFHLRALL